MGDEEGKRKGTQRHPEPHAYDPFFFTTGAQQQQQLQHMAELGFGRPPLQTHVMPRAYDPFFTTGAQQQPQLQHMAEQGAWWPPAPPQAYPEPRAYEQPLPMSGAQQQQQQAHPEPLAYDYETLSTRTDAQAQQELRDKPPVGAARGGTPAGGLTAEQLVLPDLNPPPPQMQKRGIYDLPQRHVGSTGAHGDEDYRTSMNSPGAPRIGGNPNPAQITPRSQPHGLQPGAVVLGDSTCRPGHQGQAAQCFGESRGERRDGEERKRKRMPEIKNDGDKRARTSSSSAPHQRRDILCIMYHDMVDVCICSHATSASSFASGSSSAMDFGRKIAIPDPSLNLPYAHPTGQHTGVYRLGVQGNAAAHGSGDMPPSGGSTGTGTGATETETHGDEEDDRSTNTPGAPQVRDYAVQNAPVLLGGSISRPGLQKQAAQQLAPGSRSEGEHSGAVGNPGQNAAPPRLDNQKQGVVLGGSTSRPGLQGQTVQGSRSRPPAPKVDRPEIQQHKRQRPAVQPGSQPVVELERPLTEGERYTISVTNKRALAAIGEEQPAFLRPPPPTAEEMDRERRLQAMRRNLASNPAPQRMRIKKRMASQPAVVSGATGVQTPAEPAPEPQPRRPPDRSCPHCRVRQGNVQALHLCCCAHCNACPFCALDAVPRVQQQRGMCPCCGKRSGQAAIDHSCVCNVCPKQACPTCRLAEVARPQPRPPGACSSCLLNAGTASRLLCLCDQCRLVLGSQCPFCVLAEEPSATRPFGFLKILAFSLLLG